MIHDAMQDRSSTPRLLRRKIANNATKGCAGISMMVIVEVAQCVFAWIEAAAHGAGGMVRGQRAIPSRGRPLLAKISMLQTSCGQLLGLSQTGP